MSLKSSFINKLYIAILFAMFPKTQKHHLCNEMFVDGKNCFKITAQKVFLSCSMSAYQGYFLRYEV